MFKQDTWLFNGIRKFIKVSLLKLNLLPFPRRYKHLFKTVDRYKARRILEIGVWDGTHALKMIETAKRHWPLGDIEYYGFDLFEEFDENIPEEELLSKIPPSIKEIKEKLKSTGANIKLFKGNTLETLPEAVRILPKMDFIFIDGGHSVKTVRNDWEYSRQLMHEQTVVIFDDYLNIENSGCNKIVDSIDQEQFSVEILKPTDKFKRDPGVLCINFVKVTKKKK